MLPRRHFRPPRQTPPEIAQPTPRPPCGEPCGKLPNATVSNLSSLTETPLDLRFLRRPPREDQGEDASGAGANFKAGELLVTKREVIEKLRKHGLKTASRLPEPTNPQTGTLQPSVIVKKAWFDDLGPDDLPEKIAFAFCDGDLYSSIKTSLNLVKTRLAEKGIIIAHDYNNPELPGSARAVDEFLRGNPDFRLKVHYTLAILTKKC